MMKSKTQGVVFALILCALLAFPTATLTTPLSTPIGGWHEMKLDASDVPLSNKLLEVPQAAIVVNTPENELNSDGDCSLREAIAAANTNAASDACQAGEGGTTIDTITFVISGTITLSAQLEVSAGGPLVIDGGGKITISGGYLGRVFSASSEASLTLEGLIITNGRAENGGGVTNAGSLILKNSTLTGNDAWGDKTGGGGGIYNTGTLTVISSTLSSNSAFYLTGGGIYNLGKLTISDSTLDDNGAAHDGGGIYNTGPMTITNSTLSANWANYGKGGGFYNDTGTVFLTNSTLKANAALYGGGFYNYPVGNVYITNSTLYGNIATSEGGGIYNQGTLNAANVTLTHNETVNGFGGGIRSQGQLFTLSNTIIANNTSMVTGPDCYLDTASTEGYNLIGDLHGCEIIPTNGDLTGIDPGLGPLQDNGGPTHTQALLPGSLAIDRGNPEGCKDYAGNPITSDQRGLGRSGRCDIGAYEQQPPPSMANQVFLPCVSRTCNPVYFDNFSNPDSGWYIHEDDTVKYEYLDNEYRILVKNTNWWVGAGSEYVASDYAVAVNVRNATGVFGSYGLLFGLSDDWTQFYFFEIYPDGTYDIGHYQYADPNDYFEYLAFGKNASSIHTGNATNQLKILRKGAQIWAYANGQLLNIIKQGDYTGLRRMGLIAVAYNQPNVDVRFDNFSVSSASCEAPASAANASFKMSEGMIKEFNPRNHWESSHPRNNDGAGFP